MITLYPLAFLCDLPTASQPATSIMAQQAQGHKPTLFSPPPCTPRRPLLLRVAAPTAAVGRSNDNVVLSSRILRSIADDTRVEANCYTDLPSDLLVLTPTSIICMKQVMSSESSGGRKKQAQKSGGTPGRNTNRRRHRPKGGADHNKLDGNKGGHGGNKKESEPAADTSCDDGGGDNQKHNENQHQRHPPEKHKKHHHHHHGSHGHHHNNHNHNDQHTHQHHNHTAHRHHTHKKKPAAAMTVIINRVDLYDGAVAAKVAREEAEKKKKKLKQGEGTSGGSNGDTAIGGGELSAEQRAAAEAEAELMAAAQAAMAAGLGGGPPPPGGPVPNKMPPQQQHHPSPMPPTMAMPLPPNQLPYPNIPPNMHPQMLPPGGPNNMMNMNMMPPQMQPYGGQFLPYPNQAMMPMPPMPPTGNGPPHPGMMGIPPFQNQHYHQQQQQQIMPHHNNIMAQGGNNGPTQTMQQQPPSPQQQHQLQEQKKESVAPTPTDKDDNNDNSEQSNKQQDKKKQHHHHHGYPAVSRYYFRLNSTATASSVGDDDYYYSCVSDVDNAGDASDRGATSEPVHSSRYNDGAPAGQGIGDIDEGENTSQKAGGRNGVAVVRSPQTSHAEQSCCFNLSRVSPAHSHYCTPNPYASLPGCELVVDNTVSNPHPTWIVHDKYWRQRRRLFSRFDRGIMLDSEGWYSVTPEIIADHVAARVAELSAAFAARGCGSRLPFLNGGAPQQNGYDRLGMMEADGGNGVKVDISSGGGGLIVLDAFAGCGGNSIAFGKLPSTFVSLVVCVDIDRHKLRNAAHNASLYGIPTDKLLFIECNTLRVLEGCYRHGRRVDPLQNGYCREPDLSAAPVERVAGYLIGGEDLLPPHIDAVFMDPPWGGVDYGDLGKHGYDLEKNMKIKRDNRGADGKDKDDDGNDKSELARTNSVRKLSGASSCDGDFLGPLSEPVAAEEDHATGSESGGFDGFFDTFDTGAPAKVSKALGAKTMAQTSEDLSDEDCVDGVQLLQIAAEATRSRMVVYDLPKNTNKESLGRAALAAGYRGNIKLEEHFLNGRLKTVTAYLGSDYSDLLK